MTQPVGEDGTTSTSSGSEGTDRSDPVAASVKTGTDAPDVKTGIDADGVAEWFAANVEAVTLPLSYRLIAGGHSNLTFEVDDTAGRRFVLRRPPTGQLLATAHDMGREHRILAAVGPAMIPAPTVLGYCADPGVTGAPFYVMDFVDGHVLRSPEEVEGAFDVAARHRIGMDLVDTLAAIHALDPDRIGLGDLGRKDGYIARQLKRWHAQYRSARDEQGGPDAPDVDDVHAALVECIPEQGPAGVVHGDYRIDNTVVGEDGRVAAVLDWELCTLGDPLADLGQLLSYWTEPGEVPPLQNSATMAPGFPTRSELVARYAERSDRDLGMLDFYEAFAFWKLACILEGVYTRYEAGAMGDDGLDHSFFPESIRRLAARAATIAGRLG